MVISQKKIKEFQQYIFDWWEIHKRDLPWRHTTDPYCIMVSEIMLQQTQVFRVVPKYREFVTVYPNVQSLVQTSTAALLRIWKGMGYNRRALYLKKTAEIVVREYKGIFPHDEASLLKLPGIGKYTSRAIMIFAYQKDVAMVDTNIRKIIMHHFFDGTRQSEKIIQEIAEQLVPKRKSWQWHQALMDYGALEMKKFHMKGVVSHKQQAFKDSNRFYRGRIIDLLRENDMKQEDIFRITDDMYGKSYDYINLLLQDLIHDGLIVRSETGIMSLPQ